MIKQLKKLIGLESEPAAKKDTKKDKCQNLDICNISQQVIEQANVAHTKARSLSRSLNTLNERMNH